MSYMYLAQNDAYKWHSARTSQLTLKPLRFLNVTILITHRTNMNFPLDSIVIGRERSSLSPQYSPNNFESCEGPSLTSSHSKHFMSSNSLVYGISMLVKVILSLGAESTAKTTWQSIEVRSPAAAGSKVPSEDVPIACMHLALQWVTAIPAKTSVRMINFISPAQFSFCSHWSKELEMGVGELEKGKFFQLAYIPVKYGGGASAVIGRKE